VPNYSNTVANSCYRFHFASGFWDFYYVATGIASIGVVDDDGIVMVENAYRTTSEDKKKWISIIMNDN
jgi:hypothetical protein